MRDEDIARSAHGTRYVKRLFTQEEQDYVDSHPNTAQRFLAGRFSGREAVVKLLNLDDAAAPWIDIVLEGIRPVCVSLKGAASAKALSLGIGEVLLTIDYGRSIVIAVAAADAREGLVADESSL